MSGTPQHLTLTLDKHPAWDEKLQALGDKAELVDIDALLVWIADAAYAVVAGRNNDNFSGLVSAATPQVTAQLQTIDNSQNMRGVDKHLHLLSVQTEPIGLWTDPGFIRARIRVLYWVEPDNQPKEMRREIWVLEQPITAETTRRKGRCENCGAPTTGLAGSCAWCHTQHTTIQGNGWTISQITSG